VYNILLLCICRGKRKFWAFTEADASECKNDVTDRTGKRKEILKP
jgi:hypothetical protein